MVNMSLVCIYFCLLWGASNVRVSVSDIEGSDVMPSTHGSHAHSSGPSLFNNALLVASNITADAEKKGAFVYYRKGGSAVHILFDDPKGSLMGEYFYKIRYELATYAKSRGTSGNLGTKLKQAMDSNQITQGSDNKAIWEALIQSLEFSGVDFEHRYGLVAGGNHPAQWEYVFAESIVLTQTVLLAVTEQSYGPLSPGLRNVRALPAPQPLLVVGMIGDCVKEQSSFYNSLTAAQKNIVKSPARLAHKMRAFTSSLLLAHKNSLVNFPGGLQMDATVPGAGAFGGKLETLAKPFVDSIKDLKWGPKDEANFFIFNDDMKAVFGLANKYPYPHPSARGKPGQTNVKIRSPPNWNGGSYDLGVGLGGVAQGQTKLRVIVAGFDPISLAPHTVVNRAQSLEAQIGHATDMMFRLTGKIGAHVPVLVSQGLAHKSGHDFFTNTGATKVDGTYESVRYVQGAQAGSKMLLVDKSDDLRVWNGDRWDGWTVAQPLPNWSGP